MTLQELWSEIDAWLYENAPDVYTTLNSPVSEDELVCFEKELGFSLPQELKTLLRVHNGEYPDEGWIFSNWSFLPLQYIHRIWRKECERGKATVRGDQYVKSQIWSPKWIPFAYDGSGGYLAVDLDSAERGEIGQVIRTAHDSGNIKIASSLSAFIQRYRAALYDGVFENIEGTLETKTDWEDWLMEE